jgi:hypothetical protein
MVPERARLRAVRAEPVLERSVRRNGALRRADRAVHGHAAVRGVPEAVPVQRRALGQEVVHAHDERVARAQLERRARKETVDREHALLHAVGRERFFAQREVELAHCGAR